jgi:anaerobic magnesium-protoporphyrin IX monomethyl ester cyclase
MRIILADLKATEGLVTKDTVAGGYGSRMIPFSICTDIYCYFKRRFHDHSSIQLAYIAAICARHGHEVEFTSHKLVEGDVAIVLSSLVDYRQEIAWADLARQRGMRVGFVGLAASKMPELFADHADFIVMGEPEAAIEQFAQGRRLAGLVPSPDVPDLDSLPFPRWDILRSTSQRRLGINVRPLGGGFPLLSSRSCPEFCTYCPHRILSSFRSRTIGNIIEELGYLCEFSRRPYIVFRDPMFTADRSRVVDLCLAIIESGMRIRFECETRLDHLDEKLLTLMHRAGLRVITFGVESISPETLRKVARRPTPEAHQRLIVDKCRELGISTCGYYVFGFLPDTWNSIAATIDYSISLGTTYAQFKILTPYPGTPLWKQFAPLVCETDWEKFDGYTTTFRHPNLTSDELRFLLGAAYARFYGRPSWAANYLRINQPAIRKWVTRMDRKALAAHSRKECELMMRPVTC